MITDSVDSLGVRTNGVIGALRIASPHHFGAIIVSQRVFRILPLGPNGRLVRACPFSMVCTSERIFKGIGIGRHSNLRHGASDLGWPMADSAQIGAHATYATRAGGHQRRADGAYRCMKQGLG